MAIRLRKRHGLQKADQMRVSDIAELVIGGEIADPRERTADSDDNAERSIESTYTLTHFHDDTPSVSFDRRDRNQSDARQG